MCWLCWYLHLTKQQNCVNGEIPSMGHISQNIAPDKSFLSISSTVSSMHHHLQTGILLGVVSMELGWK